ncbi:MAG: hypothetical protein JNJ53_12995 [Rhizobiales bacterium]|nr:hypothetical protein [Hyphomicrobiales bacterium]
MSISPALLGAGKMKAVLRCNASQFIWRPLPMFNRVRRSSIEINRPFQIPGLTTVYPAGRYEVTTEEEPLGDSMTPVFKRISTTIYVPRRPGDVGLGDFFEIEPAELSRLTTLPPE